MCVCRGLILLSCGSETAKRSVKCRFGVLLLRYQYVFFTLKRVRIVSPCVLIVSALYVVVSQGTEFVQVPRSFLPFKHMPLSVTHFSYRVSSGTSERRLQYAG